MLFYFLLVDFVRDARQSAPTVVHFATITDLIDGVVAAKGDQFFLEMLAKTGHRTAKPAGFEAA